MSPRLGEVVKRGLGFPRVSGDEPSADALAHVTIKFSPRERG